MVTYSIHLLYTMRCLSMIELTDDVLCTLCTLCVILNRLCDFSSTWIGENGMRTAAQSAQTKNRIL